MRPRVAFALVLGVGALLHVGLLGGTSASSRSLGMYLGWLAIAAATAVFYIARTRRAESASHPAPRRRYRTAPRRGVEGLWVLILPAAIGLFIHLASAFTPTSTSSFRRGMWLCVFSLSAGAYVSLRERISDEEPPIEDVSPWVRASGYVKIVFSALLILAGAGMLYQALFFPGAGDRLNQVGSLFMLTGGVVFLLVGVAVIALHLRDRR